MLKTGKKLFITIVFALSMMQSASAAEYLIPVGKVVGLELDTQQITVAAFDDALGGGARASGLRIGDRITQIDDRDVKSVEDVRNALSHSDGTVTIRCVRSGKEKVFKTQPSITSEGPRLGVYLKEGVTGVGTVTWYDPDTGKFGTLGHGVSVGGGEPVPMYSGNAYRASVVSVKKGQAGAPGQLLGSIDRANPIGTLTKNTEQGVFGVSDSAFDGQAVPVGETDEIRTGSATILSTVQGTQVQEYSVEILKIYPNSRSSGRNMLIRVTDPRLLQTTGGIVQGMSGSPILQEGKLIGAVTHVLVNEPTTGYGIFIENMLDAA